ncbi:MULTISPECIES: di- and tripeptidase [Micrococcaceae]|uniref:di- and tripeptidase n=1 Tax=unclassified Kocuria TaxID=2649579 RepID=UPI0015B9C822|nr:MULTISPECIES: di- and tripeptidase [unclassified Kocuria]
MKNAFDDSGQPKPALNKALDTVLRVQRPLVVTSIKKLRKKHPDETPEQIAHRLEKLYLRDVTVGGGAVGASAFIPGIGTVTSVGLSVVAVGGYLERTAIYAQSMAELFGAHVEDPEKARTMVMALMLGEDGAVLMQQILGQSGRTAGISNKWGLMMGKDDGKGFSVSKTIRNMFVKRFLARQSGAMLGRALPFGLGAVVGGGANLALGRQVIKSTKEAFGKAPSLFPDSLQLDGRAPKFDDPQEEKKAQALAGDLPAGADKKDKDAKAKGAGTDE